jgi:chorismate lyase/3-hydroxybenzoate synthase
VLQLPGLAEARPPARSYEPLSVRLAAGERFARVEVVVDGVEAMDISAFQLTVAEAYRVAFETIAALPAPHPVRFWAFIPGIHAAIGQGLDRYMAFNAGRFSAYSAWCGGREAFSRCVATASAVGIGGDRLLLHCLSARTPGLPFENPRQVPAYRYSRRYGPLPPCFARATSIEASGRRLLLVGGTASIRGEDSLHVGQLLPQTMETLRNMASLVGASCEPACSEPAAPLDDWLGRFRELRVYRPRVADSERILDAIVPYFAGVGRIEVLQAELCRPELLVELEGVADVSRTPSAPA